MAFLRRIFAHLAFLHSKGLMILELFLFFLSGIFMYYNAGLFNTQTVILSKVDFYKSIYLDTSLGFVKMIVVIYGIIITGFAYTIDRNRYLYFVYTEKRDKFIFYLDKSISVFVTFVIFFMNQLILFYFIPYFLMPYQIDIANNLIEISRVFIIALYFILFTQYVLYLLEQLFGLILPLLTYWSIELFMENRSYENSVWYEEVNNVIPIDRLFFDKYSISSNLLHYIPLILIIFIILLMLYSKKEL